MHYYTTPGSEDLTKSESFTYDAWARLKQAQTLQVSASTPYTFKLQWGYDQLGNRLSQAMLDGNLPGGVGTPTFTVDTATNRITTPGYGYDNAGNMTSSPGFTYAFDGANRLKGINGANMYTYFGPLRIKKVNGSVTTVYIYSGSKPVVEYLNGSVSKEYVYSGSTLLATIAGGATTYHHPDHLSNRVETDSTGTPVRTFGQLPYGEVWYEPTGTDKLKFTTYERDSAAGETGLDYAMFRHYSSGLARFMSADLLGGHVQIPQSLNRYSYGLNDPPDLLDPLGLTWIYFEQRFCVTTSSGDHCETEGQWVWLDDGGGPGGGLGGGTLSGGGSAPGNDKTPANPCTVAGQAPPPSVYEQKGKEGSTNLFKDLSNLYQFRRGGDLDAQKYGAAPAYANYAFGVYESAAGDTLDQALGLADIYAEFRSQYPAATPMAGPDHPFTPQANVTNITNGFNAQQGGYLCGR